VAEADQFALDVESAWGAVVGLFPALDLAAEMLALARRTNDARLAMWGEIWLIGALVQGGRLIDAAAELAPLRIAVERVGRPVGAWHLDRVIACVAQARGRFGDAAEAGRRAFDRMRAIEPTPATGSYFALQCALALHVGLTDDAAAFVEQPWDQPPPFVTMTRLHHAFLLLCAGRADAAGSAHQQAGPPTTWTLPPFFVLPGYYYGALVAARLDRTDDLAYLLGLLEPYRGGHVDGRQRRGLPRPVDLALGRGALALGEQDRAVDLLTGAVEQADEAGASGFAAEARYHLADTVPRPPGLPRSCGRIAGDPHTRLRNPRHQWTSFSSHGKRPSHPMCGRPKREETRCPPTTRPRNRASAPTSTRSSRSCSPGSTRTN
jgi:hypothetical protein